MEDCLSGGGGRLAPSGVRDAGGVGLGGEEPSTMEPLGVWEGECLGTGGEEA